MSKKTVKQVAPFLILLGVAVAAIFVSPSASFAAMWHGENAQTQDALDHGWRGAQFDLCRRSGGVAFVPGDTAWSACGRKSAAHDGTKPAD